ncbi:MAG: helix-turn-helix transcriptional regulator [Paenibacillaceae bacterium]
MEYEKKLARRIKAFRKLKRLTQIELADAVGVSVAIIGALERGVRKAEDGLIRSIAEALSVELKDLLPPVQE